MYTLAVALAVIVPADYLRLHHAGFEKIYERCLGFLMRESEKVNRLSKQLYFLRYLTQTLISFQKSTNGVIWYIIGVIWVLSLYPLDVAVVSILMWVTLYVSSKLC